jgi:hypothetical protein
MIMDNQLNARMPGFRAALDAQLEESARLETEIKENLKGVGYVG